MVGLTNRSSAQYMLQATGKAVKQWHQSLHYNWQNATPFPFKSNSDGLQPLLFLFHSWKREWNEQTGHNSIQIKWGWITAVKWRSLNQRDTHPCLANDVSSLFIISGICNLESFPKPPSCKGWAGGTAACPPQCPGDHHRHSLGPSHPTRTADCCITQPPAALLLTHCSPWTTSSMILSCFFSLLILTSYEILTPAWVRNSQELSINSTTCPEQWFQMHGALAAGWQQHPEAAEAVIFPVKSSVIEASDCMRNLVFPLPHNKSSVYSLTAARWQGGAACNLPWKLYRNTM